METDIFASSNVSQVDDEDLREEMMLYLSVLQQNSWKKTDRNKGQVKPSDDVTKEDSDIQLSVEAVVLPDNVNLCSKYGDGVNISNGDRDEDETKQRRSRKRVKSFKLFNSYGFDLNSHSSSDDGYCKELSSTDDDGQNSLRKPSVKKKKVLMKNIKNSMTKKTSDELDYSCRYVSFRERNNKASRKSRLNRKLFEIELQKDAVLLGKKNIQLLSEVDKIQSLINQMRCFIKKMKSKDCLFHSFPESKENCFLPSNVDQNFSCRPMDMKLNENNNDGSTTPCLKLQENDEHSTRRKNIRRYFKKSSKPVLVNNFEIDDIKKKTDDVPVDGENDSLKNFNKHVFKSNKPVDKINFHIKSETNHDEPVEKINDRIDIKMKFNEPVKFINSCIGSETECDKLVEVTIDDIDRESKCEELVDVINGRINRETNHYKPVKSTSCIDVERKDDRSLSLFPQSSGIEHFKICDKQLLIKTVTVHKRCNGLFLDETGSFEKICSVSSNVEPLKENENEDVSRAQFQGKYPVTPEASRDNKNEPDSVVVISDDDGDSDFTIRSASDKCYDSVGRNGFDVKNIEVGQRYNTNIYNVKLNESEKRSDVKTGEFNSCNLNNVDPSCNDIVDKISILLNATKGFRRPKRIDEIEYDDDSKDYEVEKNCLSPYDGKNNNSNRFVNICHKSESNFTDVSKSPIQRTRGMKRLCFRGKNDNHITSISDGRSTYEESTSLFPLTNEDNKSYKCRLISILKKNNHVKEREIEMKRKEISPQAEEEDLLIVTDDENNEDEEKSLQNESDEEEFLDLDHLQSIVDNSDSNSCSGDIMQIDRIIQVTKQNLEYSEKLYEDLEERNGQVMKSDDLGLRFLKLRKRNNIASRKSRLKRKIFYLHVAREMILLEKRNKFLKDCVSKWETKTKKLRNILIDLIKVN